MKPPLAPRITIPKLDAARRQLRVAISLWFQGGDEVAIHTLACAAHQIIHDINQHRKGQELFFDSLMFREERRKDAIKWLKRDMNFFKHADNDPDGVTEFAPTVTELFIMMSLLGIERFGLRHCSTEGAYMVWFMIHHPDLLTEKAAAELSHRVDIQAREDLTRLNPREFFEAYKIARERLIHIA